jgi:hypothetical protein
MAYKMDGSRDSVSKACHSELGVRVSLLIINRQLTNARKVRPALTQKIAKPVKRNKRNTNNNLEEKETKQGIKDT